MIINSIVTNQNFILNHAKTVQIMISNNIIPINSKISWKSIMPCSILFLKHLVKLLKQSKNDSLFIARIRKIGIAPLIIFKINAKTVPSMY